tara:strand:+ start:151 stop:429 length:279 start_codon:yes stop_codon:yes gene_type:complete
MILEVIIGIISLLVVILGYTTFNLLRKNEKAEDIILSQTEFLQKLSSQIDESQKQLEKIDEAGTFKSDDEIGWFFNEILKLQNDLSRFKIDQ